MGGRYQSLSDINTLINSNNKAAAARISQSKSYGQINQANMRNHKFTSRMSNTSEYDNASNAAVNRTTGNNNNNTNYINNNNDVDDDELVTINGVTGVIVNKDEINNWRGPIPLSEYPINVDPNPIIVHKKLDTQFLNTRPQNVYIRYLRPPTPPPSDIIIQQEKQEEYMEPPPIIIRETKPKNKRQPKEDFIVIREAPPKEYLTKSAHELNYLREPPPVRQMPTNVRQGTGEAKRGRKTIRFLGYNFTLGPRKLIIERRQPSPEKPQSIIVERWLAPTSKQRRAVFRATPGQSAPFGRNSTIRNEKFDQDVVYDEIRL